MKIEFNNTPMNILLSQGNIQLGQVSKTENNVVSNKILLDSAPYEYNFYVKNFYDSTGTYIQLRAIQSQLIKDKTENYIHLYYQAKNFSSNDTSDTDEFSYIGSIKVDRDFNIEDVQTIVDSLATQGKSDLTSILSNDFNEILQIEYTDFGNQNIKLTAPLNKDLNKIVSKKIVINFENSKLQGKATYPTLSVEKNTLNNEGFFIFEGQTYQLYFKEDTYYILNRSTGSLVEFSSNTKTVVFGNREFNIVFSKDSSRGSLETTTYNLKLGDITIGDTSSNGKRDIWSILYIPYKIRNTLEVFIFAALKKTNSNIDENLTPIISIGKTASNGEYQLYSFENDKNTSVCAARSKYSPFPLIENSNVYLPNYILNRSNLVLKAEDYIYDTSNTENNLLTWPIENRNNIFLNKEDIYFSLDGENYYNSSKLANNEYYGLIDINSFCRGYKPSNTVNANNLNDTHNFFSVKNYTKNGDIIFYGYNKVVFNIINNIFGNYSKNNSISKNDSLLYIAINKNFDKNLIKSKAFTITEKNTEDELILNKLEEQNIDLSQHTFSLEDNIFTSNFEFTPSEGNYYQENGQVKQWSFVSDNKYKPNYQKDNSFLKPCGDKKGFIALGNYFYGILPSTGDGWNNSEGFTTGNLEYYIPEDNENNIFIIQNNKAINISTGEEFNITTEEKTNDGSVEIIKTADLKIYSANNLDGEIKKETIKSSSYSVITSIDDSLKNSQFPNYLEIPNKINNAEISVIRLNETNKLNPYKHLQIPYNNTLILDRGLGNLKNSNPLNIIKVTTDISNQNDLGQSSIINEMPTRSNSTIYLNTKIFKGWGIKELNDLMQAYEKKFLLAGCFIDSQLDSLNLEGCLFDCDCIGKSLQDMPKLTTIKGNSEYTQHENYIIKGKTEDSAGTCALILPSTISEQGWSASTMNLLKSPDLFTGYEPYFLAAAADKISNLIIDDDLADYTKPHLFDTGLNNKITNIILSCNQSKNVKECFTGIPKKLSQLTTLITLNEYDYNILSYFSPINAVISDTGVVNLDNFSSDFGKNLETLTIQKLKNNFLTKINHSNSTSPLSINLSGEISSDDISNFNLEYTTLDISNLILTKIENEFGNSKYLTNLTTSVLSNNDIIKLFPESQLTNLKFIGKIGKDTIESSYSNLSSLRNLSLENIELVEKSVFSGLNNLEKLVIPDHLFGGLEYKTLSTEEEREGNFIPISLASDDILSINNTEVTFNYQGEEVNFGSLSYYTVPNYGTEGLEIVINDKSELYGIKCQFCSPPYHTPNGYKIDYYFIEKAYIYVYFYNGEEFLGYWQDSISQRCVPFNSVNTMSPVGGSINEFTINSIPENCNKIKFYAVDRAKKLNSAAVTAERKIVFLKTGKIVSGPLYTKNTDGSFSEISKNIEIRQDIRLTGIYYYKEDDEYIEIKELPYLLCDTCVKDIAHIKNGYAKNDKIGEFAFTGVKPYKVYIQLPDDTNLNKVKDSLREAVDMDKTYFTPQSEIYLRSKIDGVVVEEYLMRYEGRIVLDEKSTVNQLEIYTHESLESLGEKINIIDTDSSTNTENSTKNITEKTDDSE